LRNSLELQGNIGQQTGDCHDGDDSGNGRIFAIARRNKIGN